MGRVFQKNRTGLPPQLMPSLPEKAREKPLIITPTASSKSKVSQGDQGGYVFFADGSWFDGERYWSSTSGENGNAERTAEISRLTTLSNRILSGNYYSNLESETHDTNEN